MPKPEWIVTLKGDVPLRSVKQRLKEAGFTVTETMAAIGCVTGTATAAAAKKVRKLEGVADVAPNASMGIDPPEDGPTW
ncbi:MAG: hypothetical protein ACKVZJ_14065 [Phycisphaerales bacterium]